MIQAANRLATVNEYYFSTKLQEIATLNATGSNIINLGIGNPDTAPHPTVIDTLQQAVTNPTSHGYQSYKGVPTLRNAIQLWYNNLYKVTLNATTEILPLIGSKEGIMHLCMAHLNQGDKVLIPNPGYPTYKAAVTLAGGTCEEYVLAALNNWEPDMEALEQLDLSSVKMMFVNYPHMPTGAAASLVLFKKIIDFGLSHNILIVNDNPYSCILSSNPLSILQIEAATTTAVELNSLSKSHNMAGWRMGMLCGNATVIHNVLQYKSNMDSGMLLPLQLAAAKALELSTEWHTALNNLYASRKIIAMQILDYLQCTYTTPQQGLFVWAKVPPTYTDGYALSDYLLYQKNVFITPGGIFGSQGNNYIRISLCQSATILSEALQKIMN